MQEVTIQQRNVFSHHVYVDQPGKELCYQFHTQRKNISFGLFKKSDLLPRTLRSSTNSISSSTESKNIAIVPLAHYDSSKNTIKGSVLIKEAGTYILVFDNANSLKTKKKLYFFVALRDVEPKETVDRKEIEGWLFKKGKRSMQGYQRRWVEIHSSGLLTYYKSPSGSVHGSINLLTSAIRLNHDHLLIDVGNNYIN